MVLADCLVVLLFRSFGFRLESAFLEGHENTGAILRSALPTTVSAYECQNKLHLPLQFSQIHKKF